jgi:hypothetical protein
VGFPVGCLLSLSYFSIFDPSLFDAPGGGLVIFAAGFACVLLGGIVGFVGVLQLSLKRRRQDNARAWLTAIKGFYSLVALLLVSPFVHGTYQSLSRNRFDLTHGPYTVRLAYIEPTPTPVPTPTAELAPPAGTRLGGVSTLKDDAEYRHGRIYLRERLLEAYDSGTKKTPIFTVSDSDAEITWHAFRPDSEEKASSVANEFKIQLYTSRGDLVAEEPKVGIGPAPEFSKQISVRRSGSYYLVIRSNLRWNIYIDNYRLAGP